MSSTDPLRENEQPMATIFICANPRCGQGLTVYEKYLREGAYLYYRPTVEQRQAVFDLIGYLKNVARSRGSGVWFRCACGWYTLIKGGQPVESLDANQIRSLPD